MISGFIRNGRGVDRDLLGWHTSNGEIRGIFVDVNKKRDMM
jgi:hypothetical protein